MRSPFLLLAFASLASLSSIAARDVSGRSPGTSPGATGEATGEATTARLRMFDPLAHVPNASTPIEAAREHLAAQLGAQGVPTGMVLDEVHDTGAGAIVVSFKRFERGVEVWHDELKVLMARDTLALVAIGGQLHDVSGPARFHVGPAEAFARALASVTPARLRAFDVNVAAAKDGIGYHAASVAIEALLPSGVRVQHARVKPVWTATTLTSTIARTAYAVELSATARGGHWWAFNVVIDAQSGIVLQRHNLVHSAEFSYRVWADDNGDKMPLEGARGDTVPYPLAAPDGHYPEPVPANLVTIDGFNVTNDPWLPDGAVETKGNNVDAFTDDGLPEAPEDDPGGEFAGFSPGDLRAAVTAPGVFDHVADVLVDPRANDVQRMAAVTQIFYVTNWLHDYWYDSGFDEAAGNAQESNLGRGGANAVEGDEFWALAQFAAPDSKNNAVMAPFEDGISPRMMMFVWSGNVQASATFTGAAPDLVVNSAAFGPAQFDFTGDAALAADETDPAGDACEPLVNGADLVGKVAIIDRGTCSFQSKVFAAQEAGATAVVIVNNVDAVEGFEMGGDDEAGEVTIPSMLIQLVDGTALKAALAAGPDPVSVTITRAAEPDHDGAFDSNVVAHEWGHYMHNRLVICFSEQCGAQGEGWGDFLSMMTAVREGDDLDGVYPMGVFDVRIQEDDPAYFGIRRFPYSTNFDVNPLTFAHIADSAVLPTNAPIAAGNAFANNAEVHAAGEVWASMMWQALASLFARSQEAGAPYTFSEARRRMADGVVAAMKVTPENPTYTEQRDALLAAFIANDVADAALVADAFAIRGAGTCARAAARDSVDFEGVLEDFDLVANIAVEDILIDDTVTSCDDDGFLDAGETGVITVRVRNASTAPLEGAVVSLSTTSLGVTFAEADLVVGALAPFETAELTTNVSLGFGAPPFARVNLRAKITAGLTCVTQGLLLKPLTNGDDVQTGQTTDTVEGSITAWTPEGELADVIWIRTGSPGEDHEWLGIDADVPSDTALVSPPLQVSATEAFGLIAAHAHQFERDPETDTNYDGGVIEISTDDGATWQDVTALGGVVNYGGVIGDFVGDPPATNPLKERDGFVGQNGSFPGSDAIVLDMGTSLAGQTVRLRFRIATDEAAGANGWRIDDLRFSGITNAPFSGFIDNAVTCDPPAEGEGEGEAGEGEGEEGEGEGEEGEGEEGEGEEGEGEPAEGEGEGEPPADGCACASTSVPATALFGVALLAMRRRKRVL